MVDLETSLCGGAVAMNGRATAGVLLIVPKERGDSSAGTGLSEQGGGPESVW